jgi:hypothetical protein
MINRIQSSGDWQLFSAYLDNQLSDKEMRQVEERLRTDPDSRQTLELLRRTSLMLRTLPVRRVPRNFTLSAHSFQKKIIPSFSWVLRYSSAASALLLAAVFALDFMQKPPLLVASKTAGDSQSAAIAMEVAKAPSKEPPMIIFWGAPAPVMGAYGKGGGGAEGSGLGGGGAGPRFSGIGGGGAQPESIPNIAATNEKIPAAEGTPVTEMTVPKTVEGIQPPAVEPQVQAMPAIEPLTGSGPILGIRVPEERGTAAIVAEKPLRQPPAQGAIPFRLIEIVLAVLLAVTALPAWLLKRK